MGNGGAQLLGLEKAEIPLGRSISGMVKVVGLIPYNQIGLQS
jgi:hypothetical protein